MHNSGPVGYLPISSILYENTKKNLIKIHQNFTFSNFFQVYIESQIQCDIFFYL